MIEQLEDKLSSLITNMSLTKFHLCTKLDLKHNLIFQAHIFVSCDAEKTCIRELHLQILVCIGLISPKVRMQRRRLPHPFDIFIVMEKTLVLLAGGGRCQ